MHEMMLRTADDQDDQGPCKVHHRLEGERDRRHPTQSGLGNGGGDLVHPLEMRGGHDRVQTGDAGAGP